jgi:hypothetical protein
VHDSGNTKDQFLTGKQGSGLAPSDGEKSTPGREDKTASHDPAVAEAGRRKSCSSEDRAGNS